MHERFYKLLLALEPQPEGGYTITCPLMPELITEADTPDEAMPKVADAPAAIIEALEQTNRPLPEFLQLAKPNAPLQAEILIPVKAALSIEMSRKSCGNRIASRSPAKAADRKWLNPANGRISVVPD